MLNINQQMSTPIFVPKQDSYQVLLEENPVIEGAFVTSFSAPVVLISAMQSIVSRKGTRMLSPLKIKHN